MRIHGWLDGDRAETLRVKALQKAIARWKTVPRKDDKIAVRVFNEKASDCIERNEGQNQRAKAAFPAAQINQDKKRAYSKQGFVELRGVKANAERRARKLGRKWICEGDALG